MHTYMCVIAAVCCVKACLSKGDTAYALDLQVYIRMYVRAHVHMALHTYIHACNHAHVVNMRICTYLIASPW
jgi:hypothetical protein